MVVAGGGDAERIQREIEQQEFTRGHLPPGSEPVEPRPAATICLARPGAGAFEVLLLRRPLESRFAAGAHVFPGGTIDPEDGSAAALGRIDGSCEAEPEALVAALREAFEETGLLLAAAGAGQVALARAVSGRQRLLTGALTFADLLAAAGVMLDASAAVYFARWITPVELDRRYDTRFFLGRHPGGEPQLTAEHTGHLWLSPEEALGRFEVGRLPMLFPTRKTLELLARFTRLEEVFEAFRAREVEPILAELIIEDGRVRPAPVDFI